MKMKGGKVLLKFSLREFPAGIPGPNGEPFGVAPPHWRLADPNDVITCWGHVGNGSFESIAALLQLAKLGAKYASIDELTELGLKVRPKIWTPDDGGSDDPSDVAEASEFLGTVDGKPMYRQREVNDARLQS